MSVSRDDLKRRTKAFGLRVVRLLGSLPAGVVADTLGRQLLRAGTSVGANYRAACRARSRAEFVARLGTVEEEADEALYWLEILVEANTIEDSRIADLMKEADEIPAIVVATIRSTRRTPSDR